MRGASFTRTTEMKIDRLSRMDAVKIAAIATIVVAADQLTKSAAFELLAQAGELRLLPILTLARGMNPGVAFGVATAVPPVSLIALGVVICTAVVVLASGTAKRLSKLAAEGIVGGAIGNIIDRVRFGAVRDFIDIHWDA